MRIDSEGQYAVYVGDLGLSIKNLAHLEWGSSSAWSREADEANRRKIAAWAVEHDALVILYHDPRTPWFLIRKGGDGYVTIPVQANPRRSDHTRDVARADPSGASRTCLAAQTAPDHPP